MRSLAQLYSEKSLVLRPRTIVTNTRIHKYEYRRKYVESNDNSVFRMNNPTHAPLRQALEQVVELGNRARDEGWCAGYFDYEFVTWVEGSPEDEGAKARSRSKVRCRLTKKRRRLAEPRAS